VSRIPERCDLVVVVHASQPSRDSTIKVFREMPDWQFIPTPCFISVGHITRLL
jgi:hypothetical protein